MARPLPPVKSSRTPRRRTSGPKYLTWACDACGAVYGSPVPILSIGHPCSATHKFRQMSPTTQEGHHDGQEGT